MANWTNCPVVELDTEQQGGLWVFKGTQVPLYRLYEHLATGATVDDFAERFGVDVEQAAGALEYEAYELHDYRLDYTGRVPYARNPDADRVGPDDAMWRACPLVEQVAGRLGGAWVFKNTRLPLYCLYDNLTSGTTLDEFDEWYDMDTSKVVAVLQHETKVLRNTWPTYADIV